MSKQVDERVVSMQFDNKHFESNVKTSMGTIDKLKQSLDFKGVEKGMDSLGTASKKLHKQTQSEFDSYRTGIFSIRDAWNKMWSVMEYDVAHKLKNLFNDLTITPIKTGFEEYETQLKAVQTILANTESKGSTLEDVNKALDELNKYADQTIYNFTEMTRNIGTFTAAGVDLNTSVSAIKGIANLAAVSGSTSQQASTAMYQLSQALASGTVKLMDWNSVVNAGMGGQVFQDALKETARVHGVAIDEMIEKEGSFRETLSNGWLTSEILTDTLEHFTMAAKEGSKEWNEYKKSLIDDGYTEEQALAILKMANTATDAATKVKTFSQLMEVTKESIQSGWAQTFEILIGDFEQAKELWSGAANVVTGFIDDMNAARNNLLNSAFGKTFTNISDGLKDVMNLVGDVTEPIKETTEALEDLGDIVDKVIIGDFGNGRTRYDRLTEAGYNFYKIQNEVNKKLGDSHRYTEEQIAAQDKLLGVSKKTTEATEEQKKETVKLTDEQREQLKSLMLMSDEQLKSKGYTDEQIESINALKKSIKDLGVPLDETDERFKNLMKNIDNLNGRFLWIESFKNIGRSLIEIFKAVGTAWSEIFNGTAEEHAQSLFNGLTGFYEITNRILTTIQKHSDKLNRIFKGVFAIADILIDIFSGGLRLAFLAIDTVLSTFGTDLLSVLAWMADGIVIARNWLKANNPIVKLFKKLGELLKKACDAWDPWLAGLKESENVGKYIIDGLVKGIKAAIGKVVEWASEIANTIITTVKDLLGIHSPSTEFYEIGLNITQGLVNGIKAGIEGIKKVADWVVEFLKDRFDGVTMGNIMAMGMTGGLILLMTKAFDLVEYVASPLAAIGKVIKGIPDGFEALTDAFVGIGKSIKALRWKFLANALLDMGKSLLLISASIILLGLAFQMLDPWSVWRGVIVIGVLMSIMGTIMILCTKYQKDVTSKWSINVNGVMLAMVGIGLALLAMAGAVAILAKIDWSKGTEAAWMAGIFLAELIVAAVLLTKLPQQAKFGQIIAATTIINALSFALLTMAGVVAILGLMGDDTLTQGLAATGKLMLWIGLIIGVITAIMAAVQIVDKATANKGFKSLSGNNNKINQVTKFTGMFLNLGLAMLALAGVVYMLGSMDATKLDQGMHCVGVLLLVVALVCGVSAGFSKKDAEVKQLSGLILSIAVALLAMTVAIRIIGSMDPSAARRATLIIVAIMAVFTIIGALINKSTGLGANKVAGLGAFFMSLGVALLAISVAIAIMASMSWDGIGRGIAGLTGILIFLGIMSIILGIANRGSNKFQKGAAVFMGLGVALLAMSIAIAIISLIPWEGALKGVLAMAAIMIPLIFVIWAASGVKSTAFKSIANIAIIIGVLAGSLALLSLFDQGRLITSALALSVVMGVVCGVLVSASKIEKNIGLKPFMGLMAIILALGAAIAAICYFADSAFEAIGAAAAIAIVMFSLMSMMKSLNGLVLDGKTIGKLFLVSLIVVILGGVIAGICYCAGDALTAIAAAGAIALVLVAIGLISQSLVVLGASGPVALAGVGIVLLLILGIGLILVGLAALVALMSGWMAEQLVKLGEGLSSFWTAIQPFITGITGIDPNVATSAECLAGAISALAAASVVQGLGGLLGITVSWTDLGAQLVAFGQAMVDFSSIVAGKIDVNAVEAAANAGSILVELQNKLPKTGGVVQWFAGESGNLETFGNQLVSFGTAIVSFSSTVAGKVDATAVEAAANAGAMMVELQNSLPKTGGVASWFTGNKDLSSFAENLPLLGTAIVDFSNNLDGMSVSNVSTAASALQEIVKLGKIDGDDLQKTVNQVKKLKDLCNDLGEVDVTGMSSFGTALQTVAKNGIQAFIDAFNNAATDAVNAVNTTLNNLVENIRAYYAGFAGAGSYVGDGFVAGVNSKWQAAYNAGYSIGSAAKQGAEDALDENSPSKEFYKVGAFAGEGFVNAFVDYESQTFTAGSELANMAVKGLSKAAAMVSDAISSDMDVQPTIRPVLDLSDVQAGVGQMNGLFRNNPTIVADENISAINRIKQNQNGATLDDIVSGLEALEQKEIASGDTYIIEGVTYDDGSNIADAVGTIVRAATVKRRI